MSLIKKLAGQTIVYGAGSILPKILNFVILTPYLTYKFYDAQGLYAVHGIMYGFIGLLMVILTMRLETTFFRFASDEDFLEKSYSTAFCIILGLAILSCLTIFIFAQPLASFLTKTGDYFYLQIIAFIVALDVIAALPFARLRLEARPIRFSWIKILNVVFTILPLLFFLEVLPYLADNGSSWAANIYNVDDRLAYVFYANLIGSFTVIGMLIPELKKFSWKFDQALFRKMFTYTWPLIIIGIAGVINVLSDRWLLNRLLDGDLESNEIQTGIYNACAKIAILMSLFTTAFNYAAEPFFFKQAGKEKSPQLYADTARAYTFAASILFLGILLYLDIFQVLIADNFRTGLYIVPVLLLAYLFLGLHYNFSIWYKINDKTKIGALVAIVGSVISLSINIALIPKIGLMASAWAAFFTFLTMAILNLLVGKKYYPIPYRIDRIIIIIVSAVGVFYLSEYINNSFDFRSTSKFLINSLFLFLFLVLIGLLEKDFYRKVWKAG